MWYYNVLCHLSETATSVNKRPLFIVNIKAPMQIRVVFCIGVGYSVALYTIFVCMVLALTPLDVGWQFIADCETSLNLGECFNN